MPDADLHVGDEGSTLRITITDADDNPRDISASTTEEIKIRPVDVDNPTTKTLTASYTTDGTDGQIEAKTSAGDLDADGWWEIQGRVEQGGQWHTEKDHFYVGEAL